MSVLVPGMVQVDDSVIDEVRKFNETLMGMLAALPPVHTIPAAQTRQRRRDGGGMFPAPVFLPQARDLTVPGRDGSIRLRVLVPETTPRGVYLHIHGGGWTLGGADMQDPLLWELVEATGMCAVSVEYRLAPEYPYPAGPDDCEDAARWLVEGGAAELGAPLRLAIGGESAGAHLAALTLLRLRDQHGITDAFVAANLVYGCFDMGMTPSQRLWTEDLVLAPESMAWFSEGFLPGTDREERRSPAISPLYADLRALPPALFTVGTRDPLLDDSLFMAARWQFAGNAARLRVWPEAIHGFNGFDAYPAAVRKAANAEQYAFLRSVLDETAP
jgi:acetyl esterase